MLIIPAIDLKEGKVVRYTRGRFNKKIYSNDPLKTAKHWARQGAEFLHIVDLDGAIKGSLNNLEIVKNIVETVKVPIEFGGGIRNKEIIKKLISMGVVRVIIGTLAVENPRFLIDVYKRFNDKIIVSVDEAGGDILTRGWRKKNRIVKTLELIKRLREIGFDKIIYTDTSRDGTLLGPNISAVKKILKVTGMQIIASGGIASIKDIQRLAKFEKKGLLGVIVGKALYEGRFTLPEAIKAIKRRETNG